MFVAKYSEDMTLLWSQSAGGTGVQVATDAATDSTARSLASGYSDHGFDFAGATLSDGGGDDAFLLTFLP